MGPTARLDGCEKSLPTGIQSPGPPDPSVTDYALPAMVMAVTYRKIQDGSVSVVTAIQADDCKSPSYWRH